MNRKAYYGHQEIARLYFPHVLAKSASRQLKRWINRDPELLAELQMAGYCKGQRVYTPLQTSILFDHMGDPETWNIK